MKSSPTFIVIINEFKLYMKSLKLLREMKAQTLYHNLKNVPTEIWREFCSFIIQSNNNNQNNLRAKDSKWQSFFFFLDQNRTGFN